MSLEALGLYKRLPGASLLELFIYIKQYRDGHKKLIGCSGQSASVGYFAASVSGTCTVASAAETQWNYSLLQ